MFEAPLALLHNVGCILPSWTPKYCPVHGQYLSGQHLSGQYLNWSVSLLQVNLSVAIRKESMGFGSVKMTATCQRHVAKSHCSAVNWLAGLPLTSSTSCSIQLLQQSSEWQARSAVLKRLLPAHFFLDNGKRLCSQQTFSCSIQAQPAHSLPVQNFLPQN